MTRINRKKLELQYNENIGFFSLIDNSMIDLLRVSNDNLDILIEKMSEKDLEILTSNLSTFAKKRQALQIINNLYKFL